MDPRPRILALDVGDRRIGLAISDELGLTAQPLFTLHRATPRPNVRAEFKSIARFIRQHKVTNVIVGNPLHVDGSPSPQAAKAQAFAAALREFMSQQQSVPAIQMFDERLTTREAHALLDASGHAPRSAGRSHGKPVDRKDIIDQIAATILLESFLSVGQPALLLGPNDGPDLV